MGEEIWEPDQITQDGELTRRGHARMPSETRPTMGGFPGNRNTQAVENPNTVLERIDPDEVREI